MAQQVWKTLVKWAEWTWAIFQAETEILITEKTRVQHKAAKTSTCRSLVKVDLFSVTLHEGADELAFTLIK